MAGHELRQDEITRSNDNLLDSRISLANQNEDVSAKLQREAELLRDGLSSGFSARLEHAKENIAATTLEIASSFGIGAGLSLMSKAGGRWGTAAKVAGAGFAVAFAGDIARRATPTVGAMVDTWHSDLNLSNNKQIVGHYAGSALFDYPVMLGGAMAGAGAVHFAPRMAEVFRRDLTPASQLSNPQMNLGEIASLGAKERRAATVDPLAEIRANLELPNKGSFGLHDLARVTEARRLAAHPEIAPVRASMIETLGKIDQIKPELASNRSALAAAEKQLGEVTALKTETKALQAAERHSAALEAEGARVRELRAEEARLQAELRRKPESTEAARADPAEARQQLGDVRQQIRAAELRLEGKSAADQAVLEARAALESRRQSLESGNDPQAHALQEQIRGLKETVAAQEGQIAELSTRLTTLDAQMLLKATEVRPNLGDGMPGPVPDVIRVRPAAEATRPRVEAPLRPADRALPVSEAILSMKPKPVESVPAAAPAAKPAPPLENMTPRPAEAKPIEVNRPEVRNGDSTGARADAKPPAESQGHRRSDQPGDRRAPERQPHERAVEPVIGERQVNRALQEAQRSVDDFVRTGRRHTSALKAVTEYLDKAFEWFGNDPHATARSSEILTNVQQMLGKVKNWERGASWIPRQGPERAQLMARNGMSAEQMAKFDAWYETVRGNYQPKGNQMAEMTLADIHAHLRNRVMVESVKWYLKQAPDTAAAISPVVQRGFEMIRDGQYPNGRPIHEGADMIVLERRTVPGPDGQPIEVILPFAKDGVHMQRFDAVNIVEGMRKQEIMQQEGPAGLRPDELYGFRLNHDPSRLTGSPQQVGFAILRPGGQHGKHIAYLELAEGVDAGLLPRQFRADSPTAPGTNTGSIYNLLRQMSGRNGQAPVRAEAPARQPQPGPRAGQGLPELEIR